MRMLPRWAHPALLASLAFGSGAACSGVFSFDGSCASDGDCPGDAYCSAELVCVAAEEAFEEEVTSGDGDGDGDGDSEGATQEGGDGDCTIDVDENVTEDQTWEDCTYRLLDVIYIENGATLTVAAGTRVIGETGSALVATRDGRLEARGTEFAPVVFTSAQPEGMRVSGDWGGIAMLGDAMVNEPNAELEGLTDATRADYGGQDDAHSCGVLEYARIEFAGFALDLDNELNGLTLGGCGTGTLIDHVQVHRGKDDGVEIFGGSVNLRHVVITQADDDSLDWDRGWRGKLQFLAILQDEEGENGFECDNWKDDNDALPRSNPTIYNATVLGCDAAPRGATFKEGTAGTISNVIYMGHAIESIDIKGGATAMQVSTGELSVSSSLFFATGGGGSHYFPLPVEESEKDDEDDGFDEDAHFRDPVHNNRFDVDPQIESACAFDAPGWVPSLAVQDTADTPPGDGFFLETATFPGAFAPGVAPWTENWTAYPAN